MNKKIKLSIVIPCYNEEKNIPLILSRFNDVIHRNDVEVILVNNGSTDHSDTVLKELLPRYLFAKVVQVDKNQGYGFGIISGLKSATGEFIGWTHADMQTDPSDAIKALEIAEQQDELKKVFVKGHRKGRPLFDEFFTFGMGMFETLYLRKFLFDVNAQPTIFHRSFFESWTNPPYDFSLDLFALYVAKMNEIKIVRFDVLFPKRIHGHSHWNTGIKAKWKFIKRTIEFSIKLKKEL